MFADAVCVWWLAWCQVLCERGGRDSIISERPGVVLAGAPR